MKKADEDVSVYKLDKDIEQVLHNIINVWNHNKDYAERWDMNPKDQIWTNIKFQGDVLELRVECLKGGWRSTVQDIQEMQNFSRDIRDALKKAEKDLRKEFKKKTGKAFRWSKGKERANYEAVAMNGLYKFYASKSGKVTVDIGRQVHSEKGPDIVTGEKKKKKGDKMGLVDVLTLPEKWR